MHHMLDVPYDFDFTLFGLSCHEREYRLCWNLNIQLHYNLEWAGAIIIPLKDSTGSHPLYRYQNPETELLISLIRNRSGGSILVPEYKQVDFLLKVENSTEWDLLEIKEAFNQIDIIHTAFDLQVDTIRNKENLIFE